MRSRAQRASGRGFDAGKLIGSMRGSSVEMIRGKSRLRIARWIGGVVGVGLLGAQLVPPEFSRDNPPATATIAGPPEVVEVLRGSCFDCHSHETEWPFYAWIAPASWVVTNDVAGARSRLNFSEWESLRPAIRRRNARKIVERIEKGEMPMPRYLWLHPSARVGAEELAVLRAWRDRLQAEAARPEPDAGSDEMAR